MSGGLYSTVEPLVFFFSLMYRGASKQSSPFFLRSTNQKMKLFCGGSHGINPFAHFYIFLSFPFLSFFYCQASKDIWKDCTLNWTDTPRSKQQQTATMDVIHYSSSCFVFFFSFFIFPPLSLPFSRVSLRCFCLFLRLLATIFSQRKTNCVWEKRIVGSPGAFILLLLLFVRAFPPKSPQRESCSQLLMSHGDGVTTHAKPY